VEGEEQVLSLKPFILVWFANTPRVTPGHATVIKNPWFGLGHRRRQPNSQAHPSARLGWAMGEGRHAPSVQHAAAARLRHPPCPGTARPPPRQGGHRQAAMVPGGQREDAPERRKGLSCFRFKSL